MPLDTFFIAARPENEAPDDRISELETPVAQVLLFVDRIPKEGIAMSIEAAGSLPVHDRPDVREALVEITCATLVVALSLTE